MPSYELKHAERAIEKIREQAELPPETVVAFEEIVRAARNIDSRLSVLEAKTRVNPTAEMGLPNRR